MSVCTPNAFTRDEKTTLPAQMAHLAAHGCTGAFDRNTPGAPIGSTYAVSEDGVDFTELGVVGHEVPDEPTQATRVRFEVADHPAHHRIVEERLGQHGDDLVDLGRGLHHDLGAKVLGLLLKIHRQFGAINALRMAWRTTTRR